MSKIIIIASGKGGNGKTLTSINFSLALNYLNHKVLLIDGDIKKPNIALHFNLPMEKNLHDMHKNHYSDKDIVKSHPSGLNVVLGGTHIEDFDNINYDNIYKAINRLKNNLEHEFIIIDTGPNFGSDFFYNAKIADETIVVTKPDDISIHETKKTIQMCEDEGSSVVGIIINGHESKNKNIDINDIEKKLKRPILGIIPHDKSVEKSLKMKHPVVCSYPNSKISRSFMDMGRRFSNLNKVRKHRKK